MSGVQIPAEERNFHISNTVQNDYGAQPASHSINTGVLSRGQNGLGVSLITHLHIVPNLRMSGVIPLLPVYVLMVWTGKSLRFTVNNLIC